MRNVLDDPSMYRRFKYRYLQIGSTKYRITYYSDELATAFIKTALDKDFRSVRDFFGDTSHSDAYAWVMSEMSN